jgi:hypothetical protein
MILAFSDVKTKPIEEKPKDKHIQVPLDLFGEPDHVEPNKYISWSFLQPKPWTQIVYTYGKEFPFNFFLKVKIPTLNDYQTWKQLIPNLEFASKTGELVIPSKDESGALAIANLIVSNFQGQITIDTILEKNLIPISVAKAQQHEMVRNKLREQIIDSLQGKKLESKSDYEQDLAKNESITKNKDTFDNSEPDAFSGGEFAYL